MVERHPSKLAVVGSIPIYCSTFFMIAHILGNGPSRKNFVNEPVGDVFGCNLSDENLPLKATFIMDKVCVDHIHNNKVKLNWPVICPRVLVKLFKPCNPPVEIFDTVLDGVYNGESTGHHAVAYLLKKGYTEIHMWGFDSLSRDTIESDSHTKMPECPRAERNFLPWRKNWNKIFASELAKKAKIEIHKPM